jgi:hypothetical protein
MNIKSDEYAEGQLDRLNGWSLPDNCHKDYRQGWLDKNSDVAVTPKAASSLVVE